VNFIFDVIPNVNLNVGPDVKSDVIPDAKHGSIIDVVADVIPDVSLNFSDNVTTYIFHILYTRFMEKWFL